MDFETLMDIVNDYTFWYKEDKIIVQIEGGEPLIHPKIILFIEWLATIEEIDTIVIPTNGMELYRYIDNFKDIAHRNRKNIIIKPSYNPYLIKTWNNYHIISIDDFYEKIVLKNFTKSEYLQFDFNVRDYNWNHLKFIREKAKFLNKFKFNWDLFTKIGRASNKKEINKTFQNEPDYEWVCYASDGTCFNKDLKSRSKYEKEKEI
jgi:organic radical activating enzyme